MFYEVVIPGGYFGKAHPAFRVGDCFIWLGLTGDYVVAILVLFYLRRVARLRILGGVEVENRTGKGVAVLVQLADAELAGTAAVADFKEDLLCLLRISGDIAPSVQILHRRVVHVIIAVSVAAQLLRIAPVAYLGLQKAVFHRTAAHVQGDSLFKSMPPGLTAELLFKIGSHVLAVIIELESYWGILTVQPFLLHGERYEPGIVVYLKFRIFDLGIDPVIRGIFGFGGVYPTAGIHDHSDRAGVGIALGHFLCKSKGEVT